MKRFNCLKDVDLRDYSTLKIKSSAKEMYLPRNTNEAAELLGSLENPIVIGAASNILFSSYGIKRPVVCTKNLTGIEIDNNTIKVEAGYRVQMLSKIAFENSLGGFEFLIGIPASLGGAIYMNAGAHNQTISDYLVSAEVFDIQNKKILTLRKEEMAFSYRNSILKEKNQVLLSCVFKLQHAKKEEIKKRMDENLNFRKTKQPNLSEPNLGSVFKNPEEQSAGALIDKCDMKGFKIGGCQIWQNHCNFIVNTGSASSTDYLKVMVEMKKNVENKFGINLKPEIIFVESGVDKEEEELWEILK